MDEEKTDAGESADKGEQQNAAEIEKAEYSKRMMERTTFMPEERKAGDHESHLPAPPEGGQAGITDHESQITEEDAPKEEDADGLPKELSGESKERIQRRIGKEVAKRKAAEELKAEAEAQALELEKEVENLKTTLEGREAESTARGAGTHPLMAATSERQLDEYESYLEQVEDFCIANPDGYEGKGTEEDSSYSAEQIRARLLEARRDMRVIPKARTNFLNKRQNETELAKQYPKIFEAGSEEAKELKRILEEVPQLKVMVQGKAIAVDILLGRRNRQAGKTQADAGQRKAPAVASGGQAAARSGIQPKKQETGREKFEAGGFTRESLAESFMARAS